MKHWWLVILVLWAVVLAESEEETSGSDTETDPQTAWRELLFMGWPITEVRHDGGGIEDLYLTLTQGRAA